MLREKLVRKFREVDGINEAKKVYRELAKELHPDVGGSTEDFKILNEVYNQFLEFGLKDSESEFDLELEKVISEILHYENIVIEVVGSWIWLGGNTKDIKEHLKELGFRWRSKKKLWSYGEMKGKRNHKENSMDSIKSKYGVVTVKTKVTQRIAD